MEKGLHKKFSFGFSEKTFFLLSYIFYRLLIPFEVKRGMLKVLLAELVWVIRKIKGLKIKILEGYFPSFVETKFGKFNITPDLISTITVSTAFERLDINLLISLMTKYKKKKILFLDIGANFGLYTVLIGRKFKNTDILSFEPGTEYISLPAFELLKENVKLNKLKRVKTFNIGIGSKDEIKSGMRVKRLSSIIGENYFRGYEVVFIKLDIDDFVIDGLKGIFGCIRRADGEVYLFVEDFVKKKSVVNFLEKNGFKFLTKRSPYNSFWKWSMINP